MTTTADVVAYCRPFLGDVASKTDTPDSDLVWDNQSLANLFPIALRRMESDWTQEYSGTSVLTDAVSPDPVGNDDMVPVALFLAKVAIEAEQGRWSRRAMIMSDAAGATNMTRVAQNLGVILKRIDDTLESIRDKKASASIAGSVIARELKTESTDDSHLRPLTRYVLIP